jgi:hypothetical protein
VFARAADVRDAHLDGAMTTVDAVNAVLVAVRVPRRGISLIPRCG